MAWNKIDNMLKKTKLFLISYLPCDRRLVLFCLFLLLNIVYDVALATTQDYTVYAKEQEQKAKLLIVPYKAEVDELVKNALSRQTQPDIQAFKKELSKVEKSQCPYQAQTQSQELLSTQVKETAPILVFVSFSMPKESIKSLMIQTKKAGAAIYLRGLVNNSFKDTAQAVRELVQDNSGGLLIDPILFKKYSITQVPAVVVTRGEDFDVIYGDVTLDYALEKIRKEVPSEQKYLTEIIENLRNTKVAATIMVNKNA